MIKKLFTKKRRKLFFKYIFAGLASLVLIIALVAERKFSGMVLGGLGESFTTKIYSAPVIIRQGGKKSGPTLSPSHLIDRLTRLGYTPTDSVPTQPGFFMRNGNEVHAFLNGFSSPLIQQSPDLVRIVDKSQEWRLFDPKNKELDEIAFEPELIADLSGPQKIRRDPATWEEIPVRLADAVVAVEDAGFYKHWGISPRSIARAIVHNLKKKGSIQGGSTITQQLAKNLFLSPQRNLRRKVMELLFALYLEIRFPKEKILAMYLNHIYMGQDGHTSVAGMKAAAQFYFGKALTDLNIAECALLAGIIRSPLRYNPFRFKDMAVNRRNFVLDRMSRLKLITAEEARQAKSTPLELRPPSQKTPEQNEYAYFIAEVIRILSPQYGEDGLFRYGLTIYTTMDPLLQISAAQSLQRISAQGALVALDPQSGSVWALVGGRSFVESQFNRATQAQRQPGSAFKPFVFGAALEKGMTTATILLDEPKTYSDGQGGKWHPKNFKNAYRGRVPFREALAHSLNSATLDLIQKIGSAAVIEFAKKLGIQSPLEDSLALGLGVSEVNLLELTAAYAPFNNNGFQVSPLIVTAVTDSHDELLEIHAPNRISVLDPSLSSLMTSLLQTIVEEGTAKNLPLLGWDEPCAGKTGTTNDGRDAWFIGYTPEIVAGVWAGHDQALPIYLAGAKDAVPIWARFMKSAYKNSHPAHFEPTKSLVQTTIDPQTGFLARSGCPTQTRELFLSGTEPKTLCPLHAGGIKGFFQRIFGKK